MRRGWLLAATLLLVACGSKTPDRNGPGEATTTAPGVAFAYSYVFRLRSADIAAAQEEQASACERLGPPRCRITGMSYRVDEAGEVAASLAVLLDAGIARRFGREGAAAVERAGGALVGAEITGVDTVAAASEADRQRGAAADDLARAQRDLAGPNVSSAERAELDARRAALVQAGRDAAAKAEAARAAAATTPVTFDYHAGQGVGLTARLADALQTGRASVATTLGVALTVIATLGPPAVLLLLIFALWRRWGRHWWSRLVDGAPVS